jgi:hypothetical protein
MSISYIINNNDSTLSGQTIIGDLSAVLGGQNITGSTSDTVYMPKVELVETGEGIIMKSPDGTRYKLTIANGGTVTISLA